MPYEPLTKERITRALQRLGELAVENGSTLNLSLYGGAVFTLVYGSRQLTNDVDAIAYPLELAQTLIAQVAREQNLAEDWINDNVRYFLADKEAKRELEGYRFGPGLHVTVPTAAYLLAMKLRACRAPRPGYAGDYKDIEFLLHKMEVTSLEEAAAIFDRFFPTDTMSESACELVRQKVFKSEEA